MVIKIGLVELVVRENVIYESQRFTNPDGSIRTEETAIQAFAVGNPRILKIPNNSSHNMVVAELAKMEPPKKANAYVLGHTGGEQFPDETWPAPVQFYHKL